MPRFRINRLWPLGVALLVVVSDRFTKLAIQNSMGSFDITPVIPGWLRIVHTENPGAAFGMLAEGNPILRSAVLIGVSSLVLCFIAATLWKSRWENTSLTSLLGLGLILGGAAGNLYDRIAHGTVTDFIEVFHGSWSFPAFNVADSAITVGAVLTFFLAVLPHAGRPQPGRTTDRPAGTPD